MKELIEKIGVPALIENVAEECLELGHAGLKLSRVLRGENPTPVTEEAAIAKVVEESADVTLMIEALKQAGIISDADVKDEVKYKKQRWAKRMEKIDNSRK